jgi:ABC-type uncharacterized transport system permease subunit
LLAIKLGKDQSVSGLALNMLMLGVTSYLFKLASSGQSYQQIKTALCSYAYAILGAIGKNSQPEALNKPYIKGSR